MKLIDVHKEFNTEDKCLDYLESMRWPNGVCCIACGSLNVSKITRKTTGKNKRTRLYRCLEKECTQGQFSTTSGTIFNDSHLPLDKWFLAIALIMEAKKGISANQIKRHLGINYRTAWYLSHRIREAMADGDFLLSGAVEVDETYIHGKVKRRSWRQRPAKRPNDCVMGLIERGGKLKLIPVADAKVRIVKPVLDKHISPDVETVYTDEALIYPFALKEKFDGKHKTINHRRTYGIGSTHTNTIENAFSLLKRGLYGTFHKVSIKHLPRYCNEFSYRFNRRGEQEQMFSVTVKNLMKGKALPYKKLTASQEA